MSSSSLLLARILLYLARLRLTRFQRLILLFEFSWASQRLSAQLNPGCYLFTPSAQALRGKNLTMLSSRKCPNSRRPGGARDSRIIRYTIRPRGNGHRSLRPFRANSFIEYSGVETPYMSQDQRKHSQGTVGMVSIIRPEGSR
jgi:hypothetical protein